MKTDKMKTVLIAFDYDPTAQKNNDKTKFVAFFWGKFMYKVLRT